MKNLAILFLLVSALAGMVLLMVEQTKKLDRERDKRQSELAASRQKQCPEGEYVDEKLYANERGIDFYVGPGENFDRVLNQKYSETTGQKKVRDLAPSMLLAGLCRLDGWVKVEISEVDGRRVDWETGWVRSEDVAKEPSELVGKGVLWDIDRVAEFSDQEKEMMKQASLKVRKDEENCLKVIVGGKDKDRENGYFVSCVARNRGADFNVYFDQDDIDKGYRLKVPSAVSEDRSREACEEAIKKRVRHPSTLDIHRFKGYATEVKNNGMRIVLQEFSAKNSLGLEIAYRAVCHIDPRGNFEISIAEMN